MNSRRKISYSPIFVATDIVLNFNWNCKPKKIEQCIITHHIKKKKTHIIIAYNMNHAPPPAQAINSNKFENGKPNRKYSENF